MSSHAISQRHLGDALPARYEEARRLVANVPSISLMRAPTPVEEMTRLSAALGHGPRLLVKRDDTISFAFGGNKVRKLELVVAEALAAGADTLVTVGSVQSNHARVTAATAAKLGLGCVLIANGQRPERPTANALLDELVGAEIEYIATRDERDSAMAAAVERLRRAGRNPFPIVLGASTPVGAIGFVRAVAELARQVPPPDVIVHVTSSAGTQAGLIAGCALYGLPTRVLGVSTDEPGPTVVTRVREILIGLGDLLGFDGEALATERPITVDDTHVGGGYGVPTDASREAQQMLARTEAIFVDHTYTAKAVGALLAYVRGGRFRDDETVMFWHTGGQVGLFA